MTQGRQDGEALRVLGIGTAQPGRRLSSVEIDALHGRLPGWLEQRTGVRQRYVNAGELASETGAEAARKALADADIRADELDLILSATAVPLQPIPAMGPAIQHALGLGMSGIPAFDVNSTCLSFVTAMDLASSMLATGRKRHILVVSSEVASRALPWKDDIETAGLFGDGAAAVVLGTGDGRSRLVASHMQTFSAGYDDCQLAAGGTRFSFHTQRDAFEEAAVFRMSGKAVFRLAAQVIEPFLAQLLAKAGWRIEDIDLVVPHQASRLALEHLVKRVGIPCGKIVDIMSDYGNQIAASLPTALDHAVREGRLQRGDKVLMIGTSAGLSVGGLALVY